MKGPIKGSRVLRAPGFSPQSSTPCVAKFYSKEGSPVRCSPVLPQVTGNGGDPSALCWDVSRHFNLKVTLFSGPDLPHAIYFLLFSVQKVQHLLSSSEQGERMKWEKQVVSPWDRSALMGSLPKGDLTQLHFAREEKQQ